MPNAGVIAATRMASIAGAILLNTGLGVLI
jgi:hypothetical protein